jgi:hypothetical protein
MTGMKNIKTVGPSHGIVKDFQSGLGTILYPISSAGWDKDFTVEKCPGSGNNGHESPDRTIGSYKVYQVYQKISKINPGHARFFH